LDKVGSLQKIHDLLPKYLSSGAVATTDIRSFESAPWLGNTDLNVTSKAVVDALLPYSQSLATWLCNQILPALDNALIARLTLPRVVSLQAKPESCLFSSWHEFEKVVQLLDPKKSAIRYTSTSNADEAPAAKTAKEIANEVKEAHDRELAIQKVEEGQIFALLSEIVKNSESGSRSKEDSDIMQIGSILQIIEGLLKENSSNPAGVDSILKVLQTRLQSISGGFSYESENTMIQWAKFLALTPVGDWISAFQNRWKSQSSSSNEGVPESWEDGEG
jgi:hypothetical protein